MDTEEFDISLADFDAEYDRHEFSRKYNKTKKRNMKKYLYKTNTGIYCASVVAIVAVLVLVIVTPVLFLSTGCSTKPSERTNNSNGYVTHLFTVPLVDECTSTVDRVLFDDDKYYICASFWNNKTNSSQGSVVYCVNENGELEREITLNRDVYPECMIDHKLAYVDPAKGVVLLDAEAGEIADTYAINSVCNAAGIISVEDGYLVLLDGEAIRYDFEGTEKGRITSNSLRSYDNLYPAFERDGVICAVCDDEGRRVYYQLDFDTKEVNELITSDLIGTTGISDFCGGYIIDETGEYSINFANLVVTQLADWNNINVIPPRMTGNERYQPIDDNHFVRIYNYLGYSADVVLFNYDNRIDYSNATKIVIGGYGITNDYLLAWAVYEFNSTHDDYRVVLDDYNYKFIAEKDTAENIYLDQVELIKYFNQGNAPDIFYGNEFDYVQFGASGYVQDLSAYIESDTDSDLDNLYPSVRNLMVSDGKCYSIFPAFYLNGYWGTTEDFGDTVEVSYTELEQIKPGISIFGNTHSYNVAASIIIYSLRDFNQYTDEQIVDIVDFSIRNGVASNAPMELIELPSITEVAGGEYLLSLMGGIDLYSFGNLESSSDSSIRFIGFPSVNGSAHLVNPVGQIAMSSGTDYPDECWEFMSVMLSDSIQDYATSKGYIPVTEIAMSNLFDYSVDSESIPEDNDVLKSYFGTKKSLSEDVVEDYKLAIDSIDTVSMIDWGVYNIILEEISSYDTQDKSVEEIADAIKSRIDIFIAENYSW